MGHRKIIEKIKPIHPFAARMAPEIAFEALKGLRKNSTVLDPMVGSGTVLRTVSEHGFKGIGFDIDPLAVLMSKAWTTPFNSEKIKSKAEELIDEVNSINLNSIYLPWIDDDPATKIFINFWFGKKQANSLRKLSFAINNHKGPYNDLLKVAFSRLIITKTKGASLAADVSHSRPHKVYYKNDFDVLTSFATSCETLAKIFEKQKPKGKINIQLGDARNLKGISDESISAIITSPPYLDALDYMRGHKLSLVWLGHKINELGSVRSNSVGVEKAPDSVADLQLATELTKGIIHLEKLPHRKQSMIKRYALDMYGVVEESARVLEKQGKATFVVGVILKDLGIYPKKGQEKEIFEIDEFETGYPHITLSLLIDIGGLVLEKISPGTEPIILNQFMRENKANDKVSNRIKIVIGGNTDNESSWKALLGKLWQLYRTQMFDKATEKEIPFNDLIQAGTVSIFDLSDSDSTLINNIVIANLLRGIQQVQEAAYDKAVKEEKSPTPVVIIIEEAHEFLSKERINKMSNLFEQVARIARRGRKRWLGLMFVTQLPQHLPDEVLGLINSFVLHKINDATVVSRLKRSIGGVEEGLWNKLPNLAQGQAIVSTPSLTRPLLVAMNPTPCKLLMVD